MHATEECAVSREAARISSHRCAEAEHSLALTQARMHGQSEVEATLRAQLSGKGAELREAQAGQQQVHRFT